MLVKSTRPVACLVFALLDIALVQNCAADLVTIGPGETGTLVPEFIHDSSGDRFKLSVDVAESVGLIEMSELSDDGTLLGTTSFLFDSSGSGAYQLDVSYLSVIGLVDIESLFPGLNLVGQLPTASGHFWHEHTTLSSGKKIWSYSSGSVTTLDPNADNDPNVGELEIQSPTFQGVASAPLPISEPLATIVIANLTTGDIVASSFIPEPTTLTLAVIGLLAPCCSRRRRV